jgi:hypothetical protein
MEAPTTELPNTPTKEMDENVTYTLLNHIQGKIGSRWANFVKENGGKHRGRFHRFLSDV